MTGTVLRMSSLFVRTLRDDPADAEPAAPVGSGADER